MEDNANMAAPVCIVRTCASRELQALSDVVVCGASTTYCTMPQQHSTCEASCRKLPAATAAAANICLPRTAAINRHQALLCGRCGVEALEFCSG